MRFCMWRSGTGTIWCGREGFERGGHCATHHRTRRGSRSRRRRSEANGFALDMDAIKYRFLNGRDTEMKLDGGEPTEDSDLDWVQGEVAIQVRHEKRHSVLFGVSDYSV